MQLLEDRCSDLVQALKVQEMHQAAVLGHTVDCEEPAFASDMHLPSGAADLARLAGVTLSGFCSNFFCEGLIRHVYLQPTTNKAK